MKSLRESLIFELNSSTYQSAHDKEVERFGKETNRSRRFAVAAGKALTAELTKKGLIDKKTGRVKADKTIEALPVIANAVETNPTIKKTASQNPKNAKNLQKKSGKTVMVHVPAVITEEGDYHKALNIKIPNAKYFIYKDQYHNALHLASFGEMLGNIGYASTLDDFEGFGPKDIVYTSDDPIEIIKHAVNDYGDWSDTAGEIADTGTYDSVEWAQGVLNGDAVFDTDDNMSVEDYLACCVNAFVNDKGQVWRGYDMADPDDPTENYKDYIKRVFNK